MTTKARDYYEQAHSEVGTGVLPHVEDSGPTGRPCFRRGTMRGRPDVVCSYPEVSGELDFWAVMDIDGAVYVGQDVTDNMEDFDGTAKTLPLYAKLDAFRDEKFREIVHNVPDYTEWDELKYGAGKGFQVYSPRVRCSRLAFLGNFGYAAGETTLPGQEHPEDPPHPSADTFLGWYGFDSSHRESGLVGQYWEDPQDPGTAVFTEEGWGRPAFDFSPIAEHASQSWAYAPATPSRDRDTKPQYDHSTVISQGEWGEWIDNNGNHFPIPSKDIYITNWWLLGMVGGDRNHGNRTPGKTPPVPTGKALPLYWNPEVVKHLTFFGEDGTPDCTQDLYLTILRRIYAEHCKTAEIDPSFSGMAFPPGFLVDARIMAETWECRVAEYLLEQSGLDGTATIFSTNEPKWADGRPKGYNMDVIYLGTHFKVDYKCPFPIWRRGAS